MLMTIKELIDVRPYVLTLRFNNGDVRQVDLSEKLLEWGKNPQSKFAQLKDVEFFGKVRLDPEFESLAWENGIDLCADVLYRLSEEKVEV
jgi:hypothetical protein